MFALTRLISNKFFIATVVILLTIFMGLGDPWYGAVSMPLLKDIINSYYATWGTMRMGFTYGVLFSLMGYLITKYEANILTKIKNISLSKRIIIFATFFIFYSIEGYYTHIHGYPKEYGFFILSVPVCALVLIAFLYPYKMGNIKITIPYARCLGSMSGLMYYIHILFYNYWVQHYASLYYGIGEFKLDLHAFCYVYIFTTWLAFLIYLLSKKVTFLRNFF